MTSERTADADVAAMKILAGIVRGRKDNGFALHTISTDELDDLDDALDRLAALAAQHRPPTVRELQDVIANHVRNLEPVATSRGVALAVHAFLAEREEAMQNELRPPHPGEYTDPQPVAVDVAGDEHVKRDDEIVREALTAAPVEVQEAFERVFSRANGQLTDAELEPLGGGDGSGDE